jgi:hypothetical protein
MSRSRKAAPWAVAAVAAAALAACATPAGGGGQPKPSPSKPSVAACTRAYPAWFAASAAAGKTTPTPAACKGLTGDQITAISIKYLGGKS